jgi:hypothetical protein
LATPAAPHPSRNPSKAAYSLAKRSSRIAGCGWVNRHIDRRLAGALFADVALHLGRRGDDGEIEHARPAAGDAAADVERDRLLPDRRGDAHSGKGLLKGELKRRNVSYHALSDSLKAMGVDETPENIANKISRGKFTATFLIQCLEAIGCQTVRLGDG